ncbi:Glucose-1-phosphate adenylyltransferase [Salix suchowensis]|nr:Glucose-1-phosphate adenylyltransferase [Salix suchowensis]
MTTTQVLAASQTTGEAGMKWFEEAIDAVRQFTWVFEDAKNRNIENILILYIDHLYRMNYMDFVQKPGIVIITIHPRNHSGHNETSHLMETREMGLVRSTHRLGSIRED